MSLYRTSTELRHLLGLGSIRSTMALAGTAASPTSTYSFDNVIRRRPSYDTKQTQTPAYMMHTTPSQQEQPHVSVADAYTTTGGENILVPLASSQTGIPYLLMRGGSSRGAFFNRADLPKSDLKMCDVLMAALGSGHTLNIDGIGGGNAVTTKVAMLSRAKDSDDWADVDYLFAQVGVDKPMVDLRPTCGNMAAGVGAAAIEMGLVGAENGTTSVNIRAVNTGARIVATVSTPGGVPCYNGATSISGVCSYLACVFIYMCM